MPTDVDLEAARLFIADISNEMSHRFAAFEGISHIVRISFKSIPSPTALDNPGY